MDTGLLWGGFLAIAIIAVIAFRAFAIRRMSLGRTSIDFQEIHGSVADRVSLGTLQLVCHMLGDAYGVEPRLIRPGDPLKHFFDSDSWTLDMGTEKLNNWLDGIGTKEIDTQPATVLDLMILVESQRK